MKIEIEVPDALWRNAQKLGAANDLRTLVTQHLRKQVFCFRKVDEAEEAGMTGLQLRWAYEAALTEWQKKHPVIRA